MFIVALAPQVFDKSILCKVFGSTKTFFKASKPFSTTKYCILLVSNLLKLANHFQQPNTVFY